MRMNPTMETVRRELDLAGIEHRISHRGKHAKVLFRDPTGRDRMLVVGTTPSDYRAPLNARGRLRRLLRTAEP